MQGLECYGLFIAILLERDVSGIYPEKLRKSRDFVDLCYSKLEDFLSIYDFSKKNIEKYFSW